MKNITKKLISVAILICIEIIAVTTVNAQNVNSTTATTGYIPIWSNGAIFTLSNSQIQDNGTNVGIGLSPSSFKLDVNGDLNIPNTSSYHIGNYPFLFNNNIPSCVFVGQQVGYSGSNNSFLGYLAGSNNSGYSNTYIGSNAGFGGSSGLTYYNTAVGCSSLYNTEAYGGCAFGYNALHDNTTGCGVTAMGEEALYQNLTGGYNCAFGHHAGQSNVSGSNNSFFGNLADASDYGLSNATAIGANAIVTGSNQMILGDNSVNVGIGLSGDPTGPTNKLEINQGTAGNSGLTFTTLTDAATPVNNTGLGVLAVNNTGKVVYVENTGLGNYCGASLSNPLKADYEIPLNGFNYFINGQGRGTTNVIIGETTCVVPFQWSKLVVHQNYTQGSPASYAGVLYNSTNDNLAIGVMGISNRSQFNNIGTVGLAAQSQGISNVGVYGSVNGTAALLGGATNFGVYGFTIAPTNGFVNFAVVGDLGIGAPFNPTAPDFAGYFNGDLVSTTAIYVVSDSTLKDNIQDINNPISIIKSLTPKSYTFKRQQFESMQLPAGTHYGILAQDLQNVLPGAVKDCIHPARHDSLGNQTYAAINFKAVNNMEIIPFLVGGMKQQQQMIDSLVTRDGLQNARIDQLEQMINNCCSASGSSTGRVRNPIDVDLGSGNTIILNQNTPNPFAEQTHITYTVPEDVKEAKIIFFDNLGHVMQTVTINERGNGQINVYAENLSSGIYSYTLIADGKVIDTKKMVCSK